MSWIVNLDMTGKVRPSDGTETYTTLSLSGTPGVPYQISSKPAADVSASSLPYYQQFVAQIGG